MDAYGTFLEEGIEGREARERMIAGLSNVSKESLRYWVGIVCQARSGV